MKYIVKLNKVYEWLIGFSLLFLVFFYDLTSNFLGFFDEFLALIFFIVIIYKTAFSKKIYLYKSEIIIFNLLLVTVFLGLLSNYMSYRNGKVTDFNAIIGDFINFYKVFIVYFGIRLINTSFNSKTVLNMVSKYSEKFFYIVLFLLILDVFLKIFPQAPRYGIHSYQLFFAHPSRYSFIFAFVFLILFYKYNKRNNLFLLFILVLGLTSLRVKYFGFAFISFSLIYLKSFLLKIPKKTIYIVLALFIISMTYLFRDQIDMYFSLDQINAGWSRGIVLVTSFKIGNDYFPLGTGFGSYSSYFSGKYYSWVYDKYNINNVYGISRLYWGFVADQFWPMVLAQFGYFGLVAYIAIIYKYISMFITFFKDKLSSITNKNLMIASLLGMLLLLIDSTSDAIFTQNRAVALFIFFALIFNLQDQLKKTTNI